MITKSNKELIKEYPFIKPIDFDGSIIETTKFTLLDDMPSGWKHTFGIPLCEDIKEALGDEEMTTLQVKEKYGQLRWYCSAPQKVQDIIDIYSCISEYICCRCGKPDVKMRTKGWMCPYCNECYNDKSGDSDYDPIPNEVSYTIFKNGAKEDITIDIKEYADKVRKNYLENKK